MVLHGNQILCQPDHLGRIPDHQQVDLLVDEGVLGLEHGLDHVLGLLHIRVLKIETADHQILVLAHLACRGRIDQQGVLVKHLARKLIGIEQQGDGVLDQHILDRNADTNIWPDLLVENEIESAALGQCIKDLTQPGIAKLQTDGQGKARPELRRRDHLLEAARLDFTTRLTRLPMLGVFNKHLVQQVQSKFYLSLGFGGNGTLHLGAVPANTQHRIQTGQCAWVDGIERQDPPIGFLSRHIASAGGVAVGGAKQIEQDPITLQRESGAVGVIGRIGARRILQLAKPRLDPTFLDQLATFARDGFCAAAGQTEHQRRR